MGWKAARCSLGKTFRENRTEKGKGIMEEKLKVEIHTYQSLKVIERYFLKDENIVLQINLITEFYL